MAGHPGRIFSKEQLYYAIYGEEGYDTNAIPTAIWRLRSKLEKDPRKPVLIKTVIGMGYKFEVPNS